MHTNPIPPFDQTDTPRGVCVVDGYGAKIMVRQGHLTIEDGIGRHRRLRRYHKATSGLSRVVLLAHSGYITIEATKWLHNAGVGFIHLTGDGQLLTSSASPVGHNPKLRRAQAAAANQPAGIALARDILHIKIEGQAAVVETTSPDAAVEIRSTLAELDGAADPSQLRLVEALAAATYWSAWANLPVRFTRADQHQIPDHWLTVGPRRSPITGTHRRAANPAHAILNYLYALLEAEARIACVTVGLDPTLGILHADRPNRDSLALDVMEAGRPAVDAYLLDLLTSHHFGRKDFSETARGSCRVGTKLAHALTATTTEWQQAIEPTVERLATMLAGKQPSRGRLTPTSPTQVNRQKARDGQPKKKASRRKPNAAMPRNRCADCGTEIPARHLRCGPCHATQRNQRIADAAHNTWARQQETGRRDTAHGGEAAKKRGATNIARTQARREWEANNPKPDPDIYHREIYPRIRNVSVRDIAAATGLTTGYCSMIRRGLAIPHPMHWDALKGLPR